MKTLNIDEVLLNQDFTGQIHCPELAVQIFTESEDIRAYIYANEENSEFLLECYDDSLYFISKDISELQKKAIEWVYEATLAAKS